MRPALALFALGLLAAMLQGILAGALPPRLVPDLTLLATAAMALALPAGSGVVAAVALGLATDMLSGSLLGSHALVRLLEFVLARLMASQLDLRRALPFAFFALGLSLADAAMLLGLTHIFDSSFGLAPVDTLHALARAVPTAMLAPAVAGVALRTVERLSEAEARREMRLETRRPVL